MRRARPDIHGDEVREMIKLSGLPIAQAARSEGKTVDAFSRHLQRQAPIDPSEIDRLGRFLVEANERLAHEALLRKEAVLGRLSEMRSPVASEKALAG